MRQSAFVFVSANDDIVFEEFDGDFVILDLQSGEYHAVEGSAAILWKLLMDGICPKAILDEFEAHPKLTVNQIEEYITNLVENGLIKESDQLAVAGLSEDDKASLLALTAAPKTDLFSDLSDLILADPIHDVDEEAGWPVRKPQ
ncbi:MAG: PqqD family protein [Rhodobacteraceae bacterium]|nr:PqqD family protein [Paracoccaceae bacterium]